MDEPLMYLKKRKGWWIFRRPIPKAMQPFITQGCRTEFIVSLKTKDRRQLSKLYAEALRESDRVIDEAGALAKAANGRSVDATKPTGKREEALTRRPLHEFTRSELHVLVHRWYLKAKEDVLAEARFIFGMCESDERQAELLKLDQQLRCLQRRDGEYADLETFRQAREIVEEAGGSVNWWSPAPFAETHSWFIASVREGLISLNGYARGIIENGTPPDSGHLLTSPVEASPAPPTSISLNELMKRFDSDPNREHVKKKTRDEFQLVYRMLREFLGGETAIAAITRVRCCRFLDQGQTNKRKSFYEPENLSALHTRVQGAGPRPG